MFGLPKESSMHKNRNVKFWLPFIEVTQVGSLGFLSPHICVPVNPENTDMGPSEPGNLTLTLQ